MGADCLFFAGGPDWQNLLFFLYEEKEETRTLPVSRRIPETGIHYVPRQTGGFVDFQKNR